MTSAASPEPQIDAMRPTSIRYAVLTGLTLMSVLLYLDRFAVSIAQNYIREDLGMTQSQMSWYLSAFFWSYALCQVPAGWLSDRFGGRLMLTIYIFGWSILTAFMGFANAVWVLLWLRLFLGAFQAGAYPTSVNLLRQWFPISNRGTASAIVGLGGRFGAVLAPFVTAPLIIWFISADKSASITNADVLDPATFLSRFKADAAATEPRDRFVSSLLTRLTPSQREVIETGAADAGARLKQRKPKPWQLLDLGDWLPFLATSPAVAPEPVPPGLNELVEVISSQMTTMDLVDFKAIRHQFSKSYQRSLTQYEQSGELAGPQAIKLNRAALEILFPKDIRKLHGPGWRPVLILYGVSGLLVALGFYFVTRNSPYKHPWCNDAERNLIDDEATRTARAAEPANPQFPWRAFLGSLSLWGNSITQFLTNVGWVFVVLQLPRYLSDVHRVPLVMNGTMTMFPSLIGIVGSFAGGRATDWAFRRFGLKLGRRIPLVSSRFTAAGGFAFCLLLGTLFTPSLDNWWLPWLYIAGLCVASFSTDFGSPAIWSYAQDVGGKYSASILGWGNMWGNLGAAVAPLIFDRLLGENPSVAEWNNVFAVCCGVFVVAGFCAMLLDSTKPLTVEGFDDLNA